jgi:acetate kinase
LDSLGISIDAERNRKLEKLNGAAILSADGARVRVMVIPAAEDLTIVKHVCRLLKQSASDPR